MKFSECDPLQPRGPMVAVPRHPAVHVGLPVHPRRVVRVLEMTDADNQFPILLAHACRDA